MYQGPEQPEQTQTSEHHVPSISLECDPCVMDTASRSSIKKEEHFEGNSLRSLRTFQERLVVKDGIWR